jgi:hypothetical protein
MSAQGTDQNGGAIANKNNNEKKAPTILEIQSSEHIHVSASPTVISQNVLSVGAEGQRTGVSAVPSGIDSDVFSQSIDDRIDIVFPKRKSTYYSLTESEIDAYAQFGWFSTILLTLFGAFVGFSLGCVIAIIQGNSSSTAYATLKSSAILTGVVSLIFLGFAIVLIYFQQKNKKEWKSKV